MLLALGLLAPLALAAGAVAGPGQAPPPARPFRAFLPGIAAGDAAAAVQPPLSGAVTVRGIALRSDISGDWLTGDVVNGLDHAISNVRLQVVAAGLTRTTTARIVALAPGASSPFVYFVTGRLAAGETPSVTVLAYDDPAAATPVSGLTVEVGGPVGVQFGVPDPRTGYWPYSTDVWGMNGTVSNTSGRPWDLQEAIVTVRGGNGNVALVASTTTFGNIEGPVDSTLLGPGKTATFQVLVPMAAYSAIAGTTTASAAVNAQPR